MFLESNPKATTTKGKIGISLIKISKMCISKGYSYKVKKVADRECKICPIIHLRDIVSRIYEEACEWIDQN